MNLPLRQPQQSFLNICNSVSGHKISQSFEYLAVHAQAALRGVRGPVLVQLNIVTVIVIPSVNTE